MSMYVRLCLEWKIVEIYKCQNRILKIKTLYGKLYFKLLINADNAFYFEQLSYFVHYYVVNRRFLQKSLLTLCL